jgi:putative component of toxin-antitoxin plasmid stabilization module
MAASKVQVKLLGIKEFNEGVMTQLPQKIRGRIMRDAFKKAAKPAVKTMKAEVPKRLPTPRANRYGDPRPADENLRELRKSIGSKIKTYKNTGTTVAIIGPRTGEKFRAKGVSRDVMIENPRLSTIAVAIERGWKGRGVNRFVRRGFLAARRQFPKDLARQLGPAIEKEAARIYKKSGSGKNLSSSENEAHFILGDYA